MHRIDTPTAQKDKFGAGKNGFTRGNPQTGTPSTDLDDDYFDMLQEELCGVVEASGESLKKGRHDQLLTALLALALSRKNPFADIKSDGTVKTAIENLGLKEAVDKAENAVSKKLIRTIKTGSMASCNQYGIYEVSVADTSLVPDFPKYNDVPLYGYGVLFVSYTPETGTVTQQYLSHDGVIASRVKWASQVDFRPWLIAYSNLTKPTPQDLSLGNAAGKDVGNGDGMVAPGNVTIGIGQTYQDVTSSRSVGVVYTNSQSRPMVVKVKVNGWPKTEASIYINGVQAAGANAANVEGQSQWLYPYAIIPPGATYSVSVNNGQLINWVELR